MSNDDLTPVLQKIETAKDAVLGELKKKGPQWWDWVSLLLPILLGFGVLMVQKDLEKKIEQSTKGLETRLAITRDFYTRRLAVYETVYNKTVALLDALQVAQVQGGASGELNKALGEFYRSYAANTLYVGGELRGPLEKLWLEVAQNDPKGVDRKVIKTTVEEIEAQMSRDLHVEDIGRVSSDLWK